MNFERIKEEMMELWKETFHDSEEYVRLIFDSYFNPDYIEFEEINGHVVASMLGVPYTFGNEYLHINGVYLCGLATKENERGNGIMTRLIKRMEDKVRQKGQSFLFLIPAGESLQMYYNDRGFVNGFYKTERRFTPLHDFRNDYFSEIKKEKPIVGTLKKEHYRLLKTAIIDDVKSDEFLSKVQNIIDYILSVERKQKGFSIYQDSDQIRVFLTETIISGGRVYICEAPKGEIVGVSLVDLDEGEIKEKGRFVDNRAVRYRLLEAASLDNPESRITTIEYDDSEFLLSDRAIVDTFYNTVLPEADQVGAVGVGERVYNPVEHMKIYGMIKILDISEILKFLTKWRNDLKFSILAKQQNNDKIVRFIGDKGSLYIKEDVYGIGNGKSETCLPDNPGVLNIGNENEEKVYRIEDIAKILFRRPGGDLLIEEAFGLPALKGKIQLMLD